MRRNSLMYFAAIIAILTSGAAEGTAQQSVTVVSFGGSYQDALRQALYEPAAEALGITIFEDSLRGIADVRLQVQGGNTTWDVIEVARQYCLAEEAEQLLEPLDFNVIPNASELGDSGRGENWVSGPTRFSYVLAWNKSKYADNPPQSWADFFDTEQFPGNRALYGQARFMLELSLLGDGVPMDEVYPIDIERALGKAREIKPDVVSFYASHGQSVQLIKDGEVDMLVMTDGRAVAAIEDGADIEFTYNQGIIDSGCLAVPMGAPNKDLAMRFINEMISAENQANIPTVFHYGPVNPKAYDTGKISEDVAASLNSSAENLALQLTLDSRWWAENENTAQTMWDAMLQE